MTQTFDFQPHLVGPNLELRPLVAEDFAAVHAAASDPLIWEVHPDPLRWQAERFRSTFFDSAVKGGAAFVVIDRADGSVIGSSRYYDWEPDQKEVAIGYTFLKRSHWGGRYNREMKQLMLDHAFRWAERVWFHVGADNIRSRRAMEKIGGKLAFIRERPFNGQPIPYAFFCIERSEWERGREA